MGLLDYHVHTARCGHAQGEMEEYARAARKAGLAEMGFADHFPLYFLPPEDRDPGLAMSFEQLPAYIQEVRLLQHRLNPYPLRLGVEADYWPGREAELRQLLSAYPFDYVYGSVHFVGDWDVSDGRQSDRYSRAEVEELYRTYFSLIQRAAASGLFDIIGHADVVKKFGHRPEGPLDGLYEETARAFARAGVCVEVNTSGLRHQAGEVYPSRRLLECCFRHNVPVTLGSDAHRPQEVAAGFAHAREVLLATGYRYLSGFRARERYVIPL